MQDTGLFNELLIIVLVVAGLLLLYIITRMYRKPEREKSNYLSALEDLADGKEKMAIQKLKEAVRENTENIDAYLRLADLLREKGFASNALKIHRDLTLRTNLSEELRGKVKYSIMLDYEVLENTTAAIKEARSLLKEDKENTEIAYKLLKYLEKEQRWDEAFSAIKKHFRKIPISLKKRSALYLVFEGLELQKKGQGRDGRLKYREAVKIDPECTAAYYYLGISYINEDRLEDAIKEWQKLNENIPSKAYLAFDSLEKTWFEVGKFTEAERYYKNILARDPENIHAAIALAEINNKKEDFDSALNILEKIRDSHPADPRVVAYYIQTLCHKNQYKNASSIALDYFLEAQSLEEQQYVCQECHHNSEEPLWMCPQCKSIASFEV